ncbi:MAG: hypothetical protein WB810_11300, partial [Candidatus Cybelea sp.]
IEDQVHRFNEREKTDGERFPVVVKPTDGVRFAYQDVDTEGLNLMRNYWPYPIVPLIYLASCLAVAVWAYKNNHMSLFRHLTGY